MTAPTPGAQNCSNPVRPRSILARADVLSPVPLLQQQCVVPNGASRWGWLFSQDVSFSGKGPANGLRPASAGPPLDAATQWANHLRVSTKLKSGGVGSGSSGQASATPPVLSVSSVDHMDQSVFASGPLMFLGRASSPTSFYGRHDYEYDSYGPCGRSRFGLGRSVWRVR